MIARSTGGGGTDGADKLREHAIKDVKKRRRGDFGEEEKQRTAKMNLVEESSRKKYTTRRDEMVAVDRWEGVRVQEADKRT